MPMIAHCYLGLLGELAITANHSCHRVSNDKAMSDPQFNTMQFQPDYPRRFESYDHAMHWCEDYVRWYNKDPHHSSLVGFTPQQVFTGEFLEVARLMQTALYDMPDCHPERFSNGRPIAQGMPPTVVCINLIPEDSDQVTAEKGRQLPVTAACDRKSNLIFKKLAQARLTRSAGAAYRRCVATFGHRRYQ